MSFDRIARAYPWLERICAFGHMQACRVSHIASISTPNRILLCGEGSGRFLATAARQFPSTPIAVVDNSSEMLAEARNRHGTDSPLVSWHHEDLFNWTPPAGPIDLIVTNFFFDCFDSESIKLLASRLTKFASPTTSLLLADFQIPRHRPMRWIAQALVWVLYRFFRITTGLQASTLVDPSPYLEEAGFYLKKRSVSCAGMLRADHWEFRLP